MKRVARGEASGSHSGSADAFMISRATTPLFTQAFRFVATQPGGRDGDLSKKSGSRRYPAQGQHGFQPLSGALPSGLEVTSQQAVKVEFLKVKEVVGGLGRRVATALG
jgi:hypothetical protein